MKAGFCLCCCMCGCMLHVCVYRHLCMHVEARGQLHTPCFFTDLGLAKQATLSGQEVLKILCTHLPSPGTAKRNSTVFTWVLGLELSSSCLRGKHFTPRSVETILPIFFFLNVLPTCHAYVPFYTPGAQGGQRRAAGSPGTEVADGCELPWRCQDLNLLQTSSQRSHLLCHLSSPNNT